jgi:hypothetical protein
MKKTKQFNDLIELENIKPEVGKSGIFFPVNVEHVNLNKYHGDARSFGYHFDEGPCSVVTFEQVVGVLAEDTIELLDECAAMKKHGLKKPHRSILDIIENGAPCDTNNAELLIRYGSEFFYKDEHGYFFVTEFFCHGEPQRVTNESAEIYREVNREYQRQVKKYNATMKEALGNIELLKSTLDD